MLGNELDARQALKTNRRGVFIPLASKESRCSCNSYRSQLTLRLHSITCVNRAGRLGIWKEASLEDCGLEGATWCVCVCVCAVHSSGGGRKRGQPSVLSRSALCASR